MTLHGESRTGGRGEAGGRSSTWHDLAGDQHPLRIGDADRTERRAVARAFHYPGRRGGRHHPWGPVCLPGITRGCPMSPPARRRFPDATGVKAADDVPKAQTKATQPPKADRKGPDADEGVTLGTVLPLVVAIIPQAGSADIDPRLTEIKVADGKGMQDDRRSWSPLDEVSLPETSGEPGYQGGRRTCVLPVGMNPARRIPSGRARSSGASKIRPAGPQSHTYARSRSGVQGHGGVPRLPPRPRRGSRASSSSLSARLPGPSAFRPARPAGCRRSPIGRFRAAGR